MYLFILESIGTQELILIGVIALIVFGPRKLPDLAKTIGKTMAEFRKVTGEFKSTWEKEVAEDKELLKTFAGDPLETGNFIGGINSELEPENKLLAPQVKELSPEEISTIFQNKEIQAKTPHIEESQTEPTAAKHDWL